VLSTANCWPSVLALAFQRGQSSDASRVKRASGSRASTGCCRHRRLHLRPQATLARRAVSGAARDAVRIPPHSQTSLRRAQPAHDAQHRRDCLLIPRARSQEAGFTRQGCARAGQVLGSCAKQASQADSSDARSFMIRASGTFLSLKPLQLSIPRFQVSANHKN
jgi:hypothetical protein